MHSILPAGALALSLLGTLSLAGAQVAGRPSAPLGPVERDTVAIASPFVRVDDTGARGVASLAFGPTAYHVLDELHGATPLVRLEGFPLPGERDVDLLLRPVGAMEPGATATVIAADGTRSSLAPSVRLFSGSVPGRASRAFLGISGEMLHGYVTLEGETYVLSSGQDGAPGSAVIGHGDALVGSDLEPFCGWAADAGAGDDGPDNTGAIGKFQVAETKIFLELDNQYRALFSTDQEAIDYAVLLTTATSEIYRRDLGVTLTIPSGYVQVWNQTPPWGVVSTFDDISAFSNWWKSGANPNNGKPRAIAHLLTTPVFGGVAASIGGVCNTVTGYAISSVYGAFPYPVQHTSGSNWDLLVFTHENGHVYGSRHTFDYSPPIRCNDGSGPDNGTIMSYCHQTYGVGGVGMRFHERVQDTIRNLFGSKACPKAVGFARGDYDLSGVVDGADLAELDAYRVQGFVSRATERAFDFDNDGVVDDFDRDILVLLTQGPIAPASSTVRTGSGTNCAYCFVELTAPLLGGTWSTYVGSYIGDPVLTMVIGATAPLGPGVQTTYGELLVGINGFGGQTLFQSLAMTNGQYAQHDIALPKVSSLIGLTVHTQAAIFWPIGTPLTNAIDLRLAPF